VRILPELIRYDIQRVVSIGVSRLSLEIIKKKMLKSRKISAFYIQAEDF